MNLFAKLSVCLCLCHTPIANAEPPRDTTCEDNAAWGYINKSGDVVIPLKFERASSFHEGLAAVRWKGKGWGYLSNTGKIVVPPNYNYAGNFKEGVACVQKKGKSASWITIDAKGKRVFKEFENCVQPSDGLILTTKEGERGYYDLSGKLVKPLGKSWWSKLTKETPEYHEFKSNLAAINFPEGDGLGQCGFLDKSGKIVEIKIKNKCAVFDVHGDRAKVMVSNSKTNSFKYGFVDRQGQFKIDAKYESAGEFYQGFVSVERKYRWGFIDKNGKILIPLKYGFEDYDREHDFMNSDPRFVEGLALLYTGRKYSDVQKWFFFNTSGKIAINVGVAQIVMAFSEGLAFVSNDSKWFIDKKGKRVLDVSQYYENGGHFKSGLLAVCKPQK